MTSKDLCSSEHIFKRNSFFYFIFLNASVEVDAKICQVINSM